MPTALRWTALFLKAKPDERTELLSQITGTGIYSDISTAAYRYAASAKAGLEELRRQYSAEPILPAEVRNEREQQLAGLGNRLVAIKKEIAVLVERITQAKAYIGYLEESGKIDIESSQIVKDKESALVELRSLELHEKAGPFIARLTERDLLAKLQADDETMLGVLRQKLPILTEQVETTRLEAEASRLKLDEAIQEEDRLKPLWAEVNKLDGELSVKQNAANQRTTVRQQAEIALKGLHADLESKQRFLKAQKTGLAEISTWLEAHAIDAGIAQILPDLQAAFVQWRDNLPALDESRKEVAILEKTILKNEKALAGFEADSVKLKADCEEKTALANKIRIEVQALAENRSFVEWEQDRDTAQSRLLLFNDLQTLASELGADSVRRSQLQEAIQTHTAKETTLELEIHGKGDQLRLASQLVVEKQKNVDLIRLVQSLEQQRHSLVEGEACPLCGSSDHPYASPKHLPSLQLSTAIAEHQKALTQQEQFREALGDLEKLKAAQNADLKRATADLKILIEQIERREILWTTKVTDLGIELNATQNAELNVFLVDETQRQALLKKRVADLRNQEGALRIADQEVEKSKSLLGANRAGYDKNLSLLQQTKETLLKAVGRFGALELSVNQTRSGLIQLLTVFKVDAQDLDAAGDAVKQMKQRSDLFFAKTEGRGTIEKEMGALDAAIAEVAKQIEVETAKIVDFKKEEKLGLAELEELQILRQGKFDQKLVIPDQERVSSLIKESRKKNESVLEVLNNRGNEEKKCKTDLDRVVNEVQIRGVKLNEDTTKLTLDVNTAGFETLNHLRNSVLTEPQVNEIGVLRKGLENRAQALVGRRAANDALKIPDTAKNDAPEIESLTDQQIKIEAERELLHQNSGAIKEELRQDDERRKSQLAILEQIQTAEQGFQRWDCLSKLIGSAKGVVFAKFAQSLTLERLIAVANRHLAQLSPRYSMSRSKADIDDLEIEIIDHYQGDVTRPMSSLSGGESFLASLALAVGLSELASGQTAIESLFIDEGFGSLDPGTLETAMAALETLQTSGKMIGVISHVDAMKERISTQIQIQKMEGGRSILKIVA